MLFTYNGNSEVILTYIRDVDLSSKLDASQQGKSRGVRIISASDTLLADDRGKRITSDSATAITLTVDANVNEANDIVRVVAFGAGEVSIAAGAGMTLIYPDGDSNNNKVPSGNKQIAIEFDSPTTALLTGTVA